MNLITDSKSGKQSLAALATEINTEHAAAVKAARTTLEHARRCGELLIQAKAQLLHGEWLPWLAANCRVGDRQSRRYMRVAQHPALKSDSKSDMTIAEAAKLAPSTGTVGGHPLPVDCALSCAGNNADQLAEIIPLGGRYYHVAVFTGLNGDGPAQIVETKRGIIDWAIDDLLRFQGFQADTAWQETPLWQALDPDCDCINPRAVEIVNAARVIRLAELEATIERNLDDLKRCGLTIDDVAEYLSKLTTSN